MRQFFCFVLVWFWVWAQIGKAENTNGHNRKLGMPKPEREEIKRLLDQADVHLAP